MSAPTGLLARQAGLEADLRQALIDGQPTQPIRDQLAELTVRIAKIASAEAEAAEIAEAVAHARNAAEGEKIAHAVAERLAAVSLAPLPEEIPPMLHTQAIADASTEVARCIADCQAANGVLQAAQEFASSITARVQALEEARLAIVHRRQADVLRPGDAGELALIVADQEGLAPLVTEAAERLAVARTAAGVRTAALANAQKMLKAQEDHALNEALIERAEAIDGLLLDTLYRMDSLAKRTGTRPVYIGSHNLRLRLGQLASQRPDLAAAGFPGMTNRLLRSV